MNVYLKERQAKARAEGKCIWCLAESDGRSLCSACRARRIERYQAAKAEMRCTKCGKPSSGKWACIACRGYTPKRSIVSVDFDSNGPVVTQRRAPAKPVPVASEIGGRWFFTPHSVRRFLERHSARTGCSTHEQALAWMIADSLVAKLAHVNGETGDEVWVGARPWRIRYTIGRVPPEHARRHGVKSPVVTVLPSKRRSDDAAS